MFRNDAQKALRRMATNRAATIIGKIKAYAADPASQANNIKRLQGRDGYRLRVGDYRVLFNLDGDVMDILDIGPRGGIYD
jgi:mRNA interferase RelE/StbE